jgi:branched-chain amino acid transport system ATP-binding protein
MLEVTNLHAGYGRLPVLRGITFAVQPAEVVLILGPNGAGKSTLLRAIAGFIRPERGSVRLAGEELRGVSPETVARKGLRLVLDGHRVFPRLSVADNLRIGTMLNAEPVRARAATELVLAMFPVLRDKLKAPANDLSGGQQQMLALAQAFVAEPKVLLCDEPSLGLAQALLPQILYFLKQWAQRGTAIVIVEQQIDIALSIVDKALLIERGEITLRGDAAELRADPRVRNVYLGLDASPR